MAVVNNDLFSQASSQLNFLLLSHRTMILVAAFTIAFATFVTTESFRLMKYIVVALFAFSIAYGFKAAEDFNKYISDAKKDGDTSKEEKELLDIWKTWVYFSYVLIGLIIIIMLTYSKIEFFDKFQKYTNLKPRTSLN